MPLAGTPVCADIQLALSASPMVSVTLSDYRAASQARSLCLRPPAGAFANNPKLPKTLRQKEIFDKLSKACATACLVASLTRPNKPVKTERALHSPEV